MRVVRGKNGGSLMPHEKGSNGDTHRGRDLLPFRRNLIRAVVLEALAPKRPSLEALRAKGKRKGKRDQQVAALVSYCTQAYARIAGDAALGDTKAYGAFIAMMAHFHQILRPDKDENGGAQVPHRAVFIGENEVVPPGGQSLPAAGEPATLVDKDGQTYEAVE
jgi:hypothetical protein